VWHARLGVIQNAAGLGIGVGRRGLLLLLLLLLLALRSRRLHYASGRASSACAQILCCMNACPGVNNTS